MSLQKSPTSTQVQKISTKNLKRYQPTTPISSFCINDSQKKKRNIDWYNEQNLKTINIKNNSRASKLFNNKISPKMVECFYNQKTKKSKQIDDNIDLNIFEQQQFKDNNILQLQSKQKIFYSDDSEEQSTIKKIKPKSQIITLKQKYSHLLPTHKIKTLSTQHKMLIRAQTKIDQHLHYLKMYRGKIYGQFFKSLKKSILDGFYILLQIYQFRQILFLAPNFYIYSKQQDIQGSTDIMISLPSNCDLTQRHYYFKKVLYQYIFKQEQLGQSTVIPAIQLVCESKINQNITQGSKKYSTWLQLSQNSIYTKSSTSNSISNFLNKQSNFKETLYSRIAQRQAKLKQLQNIKPKKYGKQQIDFVLQQIQMSFMQKKIFNMFRVSLIELVEKKIKKLQKQVILQIIEWLCQHCSNYIYKIQNKNGLILQINKKQFKNARQIVQKYND